MHPKPKNVLYLGVKVFSTKVLIGDTFFMSNRRWDRHFTSSSEPPEGVAACSAKEVHVPSFLSYFNTLSIGPTLGIEPATSCSAVKHSDTNWANPAVVKAFDLAHF